MKATEVRIIIQQGNEWRSFKDPVEVLTARTPDEIFQGLEVASRDGDRFFQALETLLHRGAQTFPMSGNGGVVCM